MRIPRIVTATFLSFSVFSGFSVPQKRVDPPTLGDRIKKIENGLLPTVSIKGQDARMKLADRMKFYRVPGVSIAVIDRANVEWARGYGTKVEGGNDPVTEKTLFQAASISKPITAAATLALVEQGKLNLDEEVNKRLVSWKIPENEYTKETKVTLRHLLTHTSGLTNSIGSYAADEINIPTLTEALDGKSALKPKAVRVEFTPGSRSNYSGGGYSVLQLLLSDVTGTKFPELMQSTVLKPLGMKHSFFQQPLSADLAPFAAVGHQQNGEPHQGKWRTLTEMAAGGLWSTPSDIARFAAELQNSFAGKSNKIISKEMTRQMLKRQIKDWGLGITVQDEGRSAHFSHNGWNRGYRSFLMAFTETGQGAVIMINGDSQGTDLIWEIIRGIATEYGWPKYQVKERALATVDPGTYKLFVGEYELEPRLKFTVSSDNAKLFISGGPFGRNRAELYPESASTYFVTSADVTFTFTKNERGEVKEMIIQPEANPRTAKKIGSL